MFLNETYLTQEKNVLGYNFSSRYQVKDDIMLIHDGNEVCIHSRALLSEVFCMSWSRDCWQWKNQKQSKTKGEKTQSKNRKSDILLQVFLILRPLIVKDEISRRVENCTIFWICQLVRILKFAINLPDVITAIVGHNLTPGQQKPNDLVTFFPFVVFQGHLIAGDHATGLCFALNGLEYSSGILIGLLIT